MNSLGVVYDGMPATGLVKTMKGGARSEPFIGGWDDGKSIGIINRPEPPRRARRSMRSGGVGGLFKGLAKRAGSSIGRRLKSGVGKKVGAALKKKVGAALKRKVGAKLKKKMGAAIKQRVGAALKGKVAPALQRKVVGRATSLANKALSSRAVTKKVDTKVKQAVKRAAIPIKGAARRSKTPTHNELVRRAEWLIYSGANF